MTEWSNVLGCKPSSARIRWFESNSSQKKRPIVNLIEELRWRVAYVGIGFGIASGWCYNKRELIVYYLEATVGIEGEGFYYLEITEGFSATIKLIVSLSLIGSIPLIWLQLLGFMSRGLYAREQKVLWGIMLVSLGLQIGGVAFGVKVLIPRMWEFFLEVGGSVGLIAGYGAYVEKYMTMVEMLIISAQAMLLIPMLGSWLQGRGLVKGRPWVICGVLVFAAVITPPDIGSQVMVFIPVWLLYEGGIISCVVYELLREIKKTDEEDRRKK
jgi:sec-independent protein translocase protein TatC